MTRYQKIEYQRNMRDCEKIIPRMHSRNNKKTIASKAYFEKEYLGDVMKKMKLKIFQKIYQKTKKII